MNLLKPLVPQHADGVLRVYCPTRISTVVRDTAAVDAKRQDAATWLGGVYAGPAVYFFIPSDKSIATLMTMIVKGTCDLVLLGDLHDVTRDPSQLWRLIDACIDNDVRLIVWREGIDTAGNGWKTMLHMAVFRPGMLATTKRRRKGVAARKA